MQELRRYIKEFSDMCNEEDARNFVSRNIPETDNLENNNKETPLNGKNHEEDTARNTPRPTPATPRKLLIRVPKNMWELHQNSSDKICCGSSCCENSLPKGKHVFTLNKNKCTLLGKIPCVDNNMIENTSTFLKELSNTSTYHSSFQYEIWYKCAWMTRWQNLQYTRQAPLLPKSGATDYNYDDMESSPLRPRRSPLVRRRCGIYAAKRKKPNEETKTEDSLSVANTLASKV